MRSFRETPETIVKTQMKQKRHNPLSCSMNIVAHRLQPTEIRYTRTRNLLNGNIENRYRFAFSVAWIENNLIWHVHKRRSALMNRWRLWLRWPGFVPQKNFPFKWYESMNQCSQEFSKSLFQYNTTMRQCWAFDCRVQTKTNRCARTVFEASSPHQSIEYIR